MYKSYIKYPDPTKIHFHSPSTYWPVQVADAYNFPKATGKGQTIGFIELGGSFNQADLDQYFKQMNLKVKPVKVVLINGAQNTSDDSDGETYLDLCVALAIAHDAQGIVYRCGNSDTDFIAAINRAVADNVDVISISWGGPERTWPSASINKMNAAFQAAKDKGISVYAASGDNGSSDGINGNNVDFPASSPLVVGCGGTTLSYSSNKINSEVVWNDGSQGGATGGGLSMYFNLPSWQKTTLQTSTRVVPDLAGNADADTGYKIITNGQMGIAGGTSAVAPLMAALTAQLNEVLGKRLGFFLDQLYNHPEVFRDITSGNNGTYIARTGPDPCTGMGVPDGNKVLALLQNAQPTPQPPVTPPTPTPIPNPTPTGSDYNLHFTNGVLTVDGYRLVKIA